MSNTDVNTKLVIMIILLLLLTGRPYLLGRVDNEKFLRTAKSERVYHF